MNNDAREDALHSTHQGLHRCVKAKSGQIVVLQKIFLNKETSDCFVNLGPILTIYSIPANNDTVHMSHYFGCHGNHFCVTIDTKLLNY